MNNPKLKISFEIEFNWSSYEKCGISKEDFDNMIPKYAGELKELIFENDSDDIAYEKWQNFKYELGEE